MVDAPGSGGSSRGGVADILVQPASCRSTRAVVEFVAREGAPEGWAPPRAAGDEPCPFPGVLALAGDEVAGCALGGEFESLDEHERLMLPVLVVASAWRRRGIATRLLEALLAAPRSAGPVRVIVACRDADAAGPAFLLARGFETFDEMIVYELGLASPPPRDRRFAVVEYRGGDGARDAAIADQHARAYRRQPATHRLTAETVRAQCADPRVTYLLLEHAGAIAGHAMVFADGSAAWVSSLVVERAHWGTGAADALRAAAAELARSRGCATLGAAIHRTNHASRRAAERGGHRPVRTVRRFARLIGAEGRLTGSRPA
jgi:L-amino acid N-acyltransferase YncA